MSRYEEIEVFVRTVEAGSITAAAQQLHIAKSAVSRRLKELENRLGTQLLIRTTRKLTLTDTGEALYARSLQLLADWQEAEAAAGQTQAALAGNIRIAAPLSFGVTHLGPAILDFMELHPEIMFDLDFSDRTVDIINEGMDMAIRIGDLPDSSLIARKLAPICTAVCASPAYLKRHGTPKIPNDLQAHKELRYGYRKSATWFYHGPDGQKGHIEMQPRVRATNGEFLRDAALAHQGVLIEPRFIIFKELRSGALVEILKDYQFSEIGAYAVYPPTRHLSVRVRTFVDFLVERFKGKPYWDIC